MKNTLLILISIIAINTMAQKDTIYFNKHWEKVQKDKAKYYRLIPLNKIDDLYQITDYYINGNPQMKGFWSNVENEKLEGESKWYFKNGTLSEITNYKNGLKHGLSKSYIKNGDLKTTGIYEKDIPIDGTFIAPCYSCDVSEYENGIKKNYYKYYKGTNIIAEKSFLNSEKEIIKKNFYDRKGTKIGEVTMEFYETPIDGKNIYFDTDNNKHIIGISNIENFKNKKLEGEAIEYYFGTKKIRAKGIYKNGEPLNGTFTNYLNHNITTYKDGIKEGEVLLFNENRELIGKGHYKNGEKWSGQFNGYNNGFYQLVHYEKGNITGIQFAYFDDNYKQIAVKYTVKNKQYNGEIVSYNKQGKQLSKGIYKNSNFYSGTFFDHSYYKLSSYKNGIENGLFIQYSKEGKILSKTKYKNGKLTGLIKSQGYFLNKTCECIYKENRPYKGEVCEDGNVQTFKKGKLLKKAFYEDYDFNKPKGIWWYKGDNHETYRYDKIVNGKKYTMLYKDGSRYEGQDFTTYDGTLYTYKKGNLNGPFYAELGHSYIWASGNYRNGKYHGSIKFEDINANGITTTTCTYDNGKPLNGTEMTEDFTTIYKNGQKTGLEIGKKEFSYTINGKWDVVYDTFHQNYNKKGNLNGEVKYYKNDILVYTSTYLDGVKYNGTFYQGNSIHFSKPFKNYYKNGKLVKSSYVVNDLVVEELYDNYLITTETTTKNNEIIYKGDYKFGEEYNGTFMQVLDKDRTKEYTIIQYKDGKKHGYEKLITDVENKTIFHTKEYEKGNITKEIWHKIKNENDEIVVGMYKNNKPFSGYFYKYDNQIATLYQYENGVKNGKQYYGKNDDNEFENWGNMEYQNGIPLDGNEMISNKTQTHNLFYKNGKLSQIKIYRWNIDAPADAIITFTENGFTTTIIDEKETYYKLNELTYTNPSKTNGYVNYFENSKKIGYLKFKNNTIIDLKLNLNKETDIKSKNYSSNIYIDDKNQIVLKISTTKFYIMLYPKTKTKNVKTYMDFMTIERNLMSSDGIGYFFLDDTKTPICSCSIINGKEENGIVIYYYEDGKKYIYKEYKDGKRIKKVRELTKKQLIKALK